MPFSSSSARYWVRMSDWNLLVVPNACIIPLLEEVNGISQNKDEHLIGLREIYIFVDTWLK